MINIEIIDEAYFKDKDNLKTHHGKHVISDEDCDNQLDDMPQEVYDELANQLSLAYASKTNDKGAQIVGYVNQDGNITKFDRQSGLCVVFDVYDDTVITLYRTTQSRFYDKLNGKGEPEYAYLSQIPSDENGTGTFNYKEFMQRYELQRRKEFAISPYAIQYTAIFINDEKMKTIRQIYSTDELPNKPEAPHITIDYIGKIAKGDDARVEQIRQEISQFGKEIKFKIIGYANDGKNEAVQVRLGQIPDELKGVLNENTKYHITLSWSDDSAPVASGFLDFQPVQQSISAKGTFGAIKKTKGKPILSRKEVVESKRNGFVYFNVLHS